MADPNDVVMTLDIDCGTLAPGHRIHLTALSDRGVSRDDLTSREQRTACRMVALEYDVVVDLDARVARWEPVGE